MKVALVGFCFNHPTAKRSLAVFDLLAENYDARIEVITVEKWGNYRYPDLMKHNSQSMAIHTTRPLFLSKQPSQYRSFMPFLFFKLIKMNPDIIYAFEEPLTCNAFFSFLAAKVLGKPFVCNSWENLYQDWFFPLNILEKFVAGNADLLLAGTDDVKKVFASKGVSKKKIVVMALSGVDTENFRPFASALGKTCKLDKEKTIVFVGRLIEMKGIKTILEARDILRQRGLGYRYLFVGFGKQNDPKVVSLIEKSNKGDIKILYDLKRDKIPDAFNAAAISLYPSVPTAFWAEQFGYSIAESLSCGVPVIGSDLTGPKYIIRQGKDGFLIKPKDSTELADRIALLMGNRNLRQRFGKYGREDMIKRFGNEVLAKRLYKLFSRLK
jgi:glycosyltransferase involved in cell wall biosynthesis